MDYRWDLAVYDRQNRLVLIGEIKSRKGTTPEWAAQYRRNMVVHGQWPNVPFFLLATPDSFYLWGNSLNNHWTVALPPDYIIEANSIVAPYLQGIDVSFDSISPQSLELIVFSWLTEIIQRSSDSHFSFPSWFAESGLQKALVDGHVVHEELA